MIFDQAFLRTKVARRILGLFLICCLLPIATIGVLGYYQVSRELHGQSAERLRTNVKIASMAILERLTFLNANLRMLASTPPSQISRENSDSTLVRYFRSIVLVREGQPPLSLIGDEVPSFPELLPPWPEAKPSGPRPPERLMPPRRSSWSPLSIPTTRGRLRSGGRRTRDTCGACGTRGPPCRRRCSSASWMW